MIVYETCRNRQYYHTYPLVVVSSSKYTFEDWETCGSTVQLKAAVQGGRFSEQDVSWTSQDPETAEVNDGLVRARTTGFTRISATLPDGEQHIRQIRYVFMPLPYLEERADT
ncbi:hypothetical protein BLA28_09270 [Eisenbergiella tayi]|uniref:Bacterial Ig-like domain (Group 2) n=1 Tax=Eisenbergiella tayi TaxID=1432052 RepID=A0A1E3ATX0_9FIRM|nr:Ig-like domain-containing protein [Eisenbergiella tayi]ODM11666.1 Bacterial Ig-like domain (group 2) [Eisenbergiella tayi]OIZ64796.1 hypothetical protein BLA28_09270 [Eisenbergiella tayi]